MNRDDKLTFVLDDGLYEAPLLQGVRLERGTHTLVGHWAYFGLVAEGDSAADVYRDLMSMLTQLVGDDRSAPGYQRLASLVRRHGRRPSDEELDRREEAGIREIVLPWRIDVDQHYRVELLKDVTVDRSDGRVTLRAFGISGAADDMTAAFYQLRQGISDACGTPEAPGPRFAEISAWVRDNGEPDAAGEITRAVREHAKQAAVHDELPDVQPHDIERHGPADLPLLVQFWGDRCPWCHVQAPVLAQLAEDLAGRVAVGKLNADRHREIAHRYQVQGVPVVLLFQGGREVHRIQGHRGARTIARELEPHLGP